MQPGLRRELWVIGTLVAGTLIAGAVFGYTLWFLVFGLGVYLAVAVRNLIRLHGWLLSKKQQPLPEARGLWGDVFNEIHLLEKETAQHRDRLRDMLTRFQEAASALPDGMVILTQPSWPTIYPPAPEVVGHALLIDKNFIEMIALLVIATTAVGRWGGLDYFTESYVIRLLQSCKAKCCKTQDTNPAEDK